MTSTWPEQQEVVEWIPSAPISAIGIVSTGMIDARHVCRNRMTKPATRTIATKVDVTTSQTDQVLTFGRLATPEQFTNMAEGRRRLSAS
jgi:hypothetical protein